jgi:4-amino-4-deoxy-L-arabinose transferase-like glycosyltransferase
MCLLGTTSISQGVVAGQGPLHGGDPLGLTLHWRIVARPRTNYSVFVHLLGPDGSLVAQQDNWPVQGTQPTSLWTAGTRVDDPYEIVIPVTAPPGLYTLVAGMYDVETGTRLAVLSDDLSEPGADSVSLARIEVVPPSTIGARWLAWLAAGGLLMGSLVVCLGDVSWHRAWERVRTVLGRLPVLRAPISRPEGIRVSWLDGVLVAAVTGLALAVRLPYLMQVPRLGDEVFEALQAMHIAKGESYPLIGVNPMFGPLFAYLLAACFRLGGFSPLIPRLLALVGTVAAVDFTYVLARRRLGDPLGAALAATLVALTPTYIVVNSHLGYSNSLTPTFTTATLLVLVVAFERHSGPWLVVAGLLAGLSLQTHLSVLPMLLGLAAWFMLQRQGRHWLRTKWPWLAVLAGAVAYSPVIWYNLSSRLGTLRELANHPYAYSGRVGLARYAENLRLLLWQSDWTMSGRMPLAREAALWPWLGRVRVVWFLGALLFAIRRRDGLLFALLAAVVALVPAVNNLYTQTMGTRYVAWLLPLVATAQAAFLSAVLRSWHSDLGRMLILGSAIVLVLFPLVPLGTYYVDLQNRQRVNVDLLRLSETIGQGPGAGTLVVIDEDVDKMYLSNAGTVLTAMEYLLTLQDIPHVTVGSGEVAGVLDQANVARVWLVAEREPGMVLAEQRGLRFVDGGTIGGEPEYELAIFVRSQTLE